MKHESGSEEPVPSANRLQKMYFFGPNLHGREKDLKKERIMEVYLNSIEMGKGIYGAEATAKYKFHTTAAKLTAGQSALIAATLPNPIRFDSAHPSAYILRRQSQILRLMKLVPKFPPVEKAEKK